MMDTGPSRSGPCGSEVRTASEQAVGAYTALAIASSLTAMLHAELGDEHDVMFAKTPEPPPSRPRSPQRCHLFSWSPTPRTCMPRLAGVDEHHAANPRCPACDRVASARGFTEGGGDGVEGRSGHDQHDTAQDCGVEPCYRAAQIKAAAVSRLPGCQLEFTVSSILSCEPYACLNIRRLLL
jgi:hypothetical protein